LIENRYMIEAPGGQVIMTATAVNAINGGIIKQSGIINVTQAVQQTLSKTSDGRILLSSNKAIFDNNSQTIAKSNTGQSEIKVAATDQVTINEGAVLTVDAEASNANAGTIDIKATNEINVAGNISANAKETGNGGTINTSSKEVKLEPTAAISASAGSLAGKAGTWNLEAANINIDSAFSQVMGATVNHTNINASALQTLCGPNCDDAGALLAETDSSIHKMSLTPTKLLLHADNNLKFSGSIIDDQGSLSTKLSSFGDLSLLTLANLTSGQVSIEAQGDVTLFGSINGVSSSSQDGLVTILGSNIAIYGLIANQNSHNGGKINLTALKNILFGHNSRVRGHGSVISISGHTVNSNSSIIQTNNSNGRGGTILINASYDADLYNTSIKASGLTGGSVLIASSHGDVNLSESQIQTNGSSGRGGTVEVAGYGNTRVINSSIVSNGSTTGGNIYIGNNIHTQSIPFSQYTLIDDKTLIESNGLQSGGVVETSGHILDLLTQINVGRGGIWIIDPYDVTIASSGASGTSYSSSFTPSTTTTILASSINTSLNSGVSVSITTGSSSSNTLTVNAAISKTSGSSATLTLTGGTIDINSTISSSSNALNLNLNGGSVDIGASLSLNGGNLSITNTSDSYIQSGAVFSGSGSLTKLGAGTLYISHANNTYTGKSYINGGTVSITGENSLGATPSSIDADSIEINNGAVLTHTNATNITISANRGILLGSGTQTIMKATRKTWNQYGPISGSGNLILDDSTSAGGDGGGGGRFHFYGANTYTGTTTIKYIGIKDPGLWIHHVNALQYSTLIYDNTYIPNNGESWEMLAFAVDNIVLGGLSGDRSGIYYSAGKTISIGNNDSNTTYSGNLSIGTLNKIGSGTLTLSGSNSFALELTEGELNLGSANAIGSSGNITFSGGTIQHSASNTTDYSSRFSLSDGDNLKIDTNGQNVTWASNLTASNLLVTKYGTGNLYINGSYSGNTNADAGSIYISGVLSNSINNLTLTSNASYSSLSDYTSVNLGSYTLTVNLSSNETYANVISGSGSIIKTGSATLTLSNTNTYTGDTTISAGTIKLTGNLNSATDLVIASGATLDLQAALTAATLDLDGTISNTAGTSSLVISGTLA
jgi:fibronectin-binding autotransporter adhesin